MKKNGKKIIESSDEQQREENTKITLRLNEDMEPAQCCVCGSMTHPDGLDFFITGTRQFVCTNCARKKSPELALIHDDAHVWANGHSEEQFDKGIKCGKVTAGQMIYDALTEPEVDRVKRVCRELGASPCDEIPF